MGTKVAVQRNGNRWHAVPEWYTPAWLLERIAAFYGNDYFDPCPASHGVVSESALTGDWTGKRVYCNPPYGAAIRSWIVKAMTEPVSEVILLVPAYTETAWFAPLYDHMLCFIRGRVRFTVNGTTPKDAPHPSVLIYRGRHWRKFADAFADLGPIVRTVRARKPKQAQLFVA